MKVERLSTL